MEYRIIKKVGEINSDTKYIIEFKILNFWWITATYYCLYERKIFGRGCYLRSEDCIFYDLEEAKRMKEFLETGTKVNYKDRTLVKIIDQTKNLKNIVWCDKEKVYNTYKELSSLKKEIDISTQKYKKIKI